MKMCRRCHKNKKLSEYYKHAQMFDGHLNICKECTKKRIAEHREANIDSIRAYDRMRGQSEHRKERALGYIKSEDRKKNNTKSNNEWRKRNPEKFSAHSAINNAIRSKRIEKKKCEKCGRVDNVHGHHDDYSKKLDVKWLCATCHLKLHREERELERNNKIDAG